MTYNPTYAVDAPERAEIDALPGSLLLEFGVDWCPHCQGAQPAIEEALRGHPALRHVNLSIGEPKHATPQLVIDSLNANMAGLASYPTTQGSDALRRSISQWLAQRYGIPPLDIAKQDGRFDAARAVGLHPAELAEGVAVELLAKVFDHVVALGLAVHQHVQAQLFLLAHCQGDFVTHVVQVIHRFDVPLFVGGPGLANGRSLREGANRRRRVGGQAQVGRLLLGADLAVILFPYMIFVCLAAAFSAACQVLGRFTEPALSPVWLNLASIGALGLGAWWAWGDQARMHLLCGGVLLGGFLQMAVPAGVLWSEG